MTVVACLSFVLSLLQMTEIKFNADGKPEKTRYRTTLLRTAAEIIFVNFTFLIIRLVVFFSYGKDESIFIAKNGVWQSCFRRCRSITICMIQINDRIFVLFLLNSNIPNIDGISGRSSIWLVRNRILSVFLLG